MENAIFQWEMVLTVHTQQGIFHENTLAGILCVRVRVWACVCEALEHIALSHHHYYKVHSKHMHGKRI